MRAGTFIVSGVLLAVFASGAQAATKADRVLRGGDIETMNPAQPNAEAVALKDGKIIYVGDNEGAKQYVSGKTEVIDLKGKYVTPGLIDPHNHVIASDFVNQGVNLASAKTIDQLVQLVKNYAEANPKLKVIQGTDYRPGLFGRHPTAKELDQAVTDRPVVVLGNSAHDAVFNTFALKKAGINSETAVDIAPGLVYWQRDDNGEITGAAIETQYMKTMVDIGAWQPETMVPATIEKMQGYLVSQGVTTVQVPGLITPSFGVDSPGVMKDFEEILPLLDKRVKNGKAQVRLNVMPFMKMADADPEEYVFFVNRMRKKYDSDMLRVDSIKMHADGLWFDRSMAMLEPYVMTEDDKSPYIAPLAIDASRVYATIMKATPNDLNVVVHADGTHMVKQFVEAVVMSKQTWAEQDVRHRVDHVGFIHPDTVAKVRQYDIPINATPVFYNEVDSGPGGSAIYQRIHPHVVERSMGMYTDLAYQGVKVSLGGDAPGTIIEEAYPVWLMQQAMTLTQPGRPETKPFPPMRSKWTIDKALESMTTTAAWQLRMEDKIGSIEVGKYADLAIFNKSLREIEAENLVKEARVVGTILNGEFTHRKGM